MAIKPMILREYEKLPLHARREVVRFVEQLRKSCSKAKPPAHNGKMHAKSQIAAIKKWAGKISCEGFTGRDHDKILYGDER
ncbi:MAG: hypothetical protein EXR70_14710 [Deltaproteobacteria bacterium]|nr:hypothetical protein [Deltaproteobacteria bacterium]